jgi:hypothetical protein
MKKIILSVLLMLSVGAIFSGCEKNDYQHPMYRNGSK